MTVSFNNWSKEMQDFDVRQLPNLDFEAGMIDGASADGLNSGLRAVVHEVIASAVHEILH